MQLLPPLHACSPFPILPSGSPAVEESLLREPDFAGQTPVVLLEGAVSATRAEKRWDKRGVTQMVDGGD